MTPTPAAIYLRVDKQPSWREGDTVCLQVPSPRNAAGTTAPVESGCRNLFVEVPSGCGEWFFVRFHEDEASGMPILNCGAVAPADVRNFQKCFVFYFEILNFLCSFHQIQFKHHTC